jgi:hypothetical protein
MERRISDVFDYEEKRLEVKKATMKSCDGCFFENVHCRLSEIKEKCGDCSSSLRLDKNNVIFKEIIR